MRGDMTGERCDECREALSARLDGEDTPDERDRAEVHLASCADCRTWWETAASITRLARTGPVSPVPPVPDSVLQAAPGQGRARLAAGLRILLGLLGALQLALGMLQVSRSTGATTYLHAGHLPDAGHLWHESAAWNIAIGAGFLWIATRPARPAGVLPILTAFVAMLVLLSASDVIAGRVDPARLFSHALVLTGYVVILALTHPTLDFSPPSAGPEHRTWRWRAYFDADDEPAATQPASATRPVEVTSHHRAA